MNREILYDSGRVQFITHHTGRYGYLDGARMALEGGCRWIQLRMKDAPEEVVEAMARSVQQLCRSYGAVFIIDDHVGLAGKLGADGVHLGQNDMPVDEARRILGPDFIIGGTANTIEDIRRHHGAGADYIGCGPFRFTATKKNLSPVLGLQGYRDIVRQMRQEAISLPVVAIGGITLPDIPEIVATGVDGIAVSGVVMNAESPAEAMRTIIMGTRASSSVVPVEEGVCTLNHQIYPKNMKNLTIAGHEFASRLFLGTGKFKSNELMEQSIAASGTGMVTVAMKRIELDDKEDDMLRHIVHPDIRLLPNTSGVRDAEEAVFAAQMACEAFGTNWLKLEIHPDPRYLLPDSVETLKATEELAKMGFVVLPYCQADPTLCKHLEEAGAAAVMPLGAPIGTNKGLQTRDFLRIIIEQATVPVVVDAGIGAPSHAAEAMEMGADACLVNTAIAVAGNPVEMAVAFKEAVIAGRRAFEAGLGAVRNGFVAEASSPLTAFLS